MNDYIVKKRLITSVLIFSGIQISFIPLIWQSSLAQPLTPTPPPPGSHFLIITFDNIWIRENHEVIGDGEWLLWAYIYAENGCIIDWRGCAEPEITIYLTPGSGIDDAGDDEVYYFQVEDREQWAFVPDNGSLSFLVFGVELDNPSIDSNDGIGRVIQLFAAPDFGNGYHDDLSQFNGRNEDSAGDYSIRYSIRKVF